VSAPFIVLEGTDGSGTTTQSDLLTGVLSAMIPDRPAWRTNEPSPNPIGRLIRRVLADDLRGSEISGPETLSLLFAADRNVHVTHIQRMLRADIPVVCDRYYHSSLVYQGMELGFDHVWELNREFPVPDLTFFLRVSPEVAARRRSGRPSEDMFEDMETQRRVVRQYDHVMQRLADRRHSIVTIETDGLDVGQVHETIVSHTKQLLRRLA
jgi:dTMP kinase